MHYGLNQQQQEGDNMNTLQAAQQAFDRRIPDSDDLPILSGTIELHPDSNNTLVIPARIEFLAGDLHAIWIGDMVSGNWHRLPLAMRDCIGESSSYVPEAYDKLIEYAKEERAQSEVDAAIERRGGL
jgi:hypothetical protein